LTRANLTRADLRGANLSAIRTDVCAILAENPDEVVGLLRLLDAGRVDGNVYSGECACLIGSIANVRGCNVETYWRNSSRPAERWFMRFRPGMTPANDPAMAITREWIVEWLESCSPQTGGFKPGG
jgi:hypothetical protein